MKRFVHTVVLLLCVWSASAADSTSFIHRIGFDIRPAILTRHHDFFRGANSTGKPLLASGSAHLQYSFQFPTSSLLGRMFPTAYQGAGVASYTFLDHVDIGTPTVFYIFQGAEIARFTDNISLGYEWNLGVSTGWHTANLVVGTKVNAYINTALLLSWRIRSAWSISLGLDFTHFSNGDTALPNVGVNSLGARIGAVRSFGDIGTVGKAPEGRLAGTGFMERISVDLTLCGAWNAETLTYMGKEYRLDGKFGILALHLNPLYSLTRWLSVGSSLDIQYNECINLADHVAGVNPVTDEIRFYRPPASEQLAAGLSLRAELKMPIFSVNLGVGHNVIYKGRELGGIYNLAVLKAFLTKRLFCHVGLKLCYTDSSNNLLLGIGWRFS